MQRVFALVVVLVLVLAARAGNVRAQDLYVVTEENAPFNTVVDGEIVGYSTEVLRALLKRAELGYRIEVLPWARAYRIARHARDVLIYTIARTPEREDMFHWIGPIAPREVNFYRLAERTDVNPASEKDLLAYTAGAPRDDAAELLLLRLGFERSKNLFEARDLAHLMRLLDAGRIDLVPLNPYVVKAALKSLGRSEKDLVPCFSVSQSKGYYLGVSRGSNVHTVERLRRAFDEIQKDGTIKAIAARYDEFLQPKSP